MVPAEPRCLTGLTTLCHGLVDLTLALGLQASSADAAQAATAAAGLQELAEGLAALSDQFDDLAAGEATPHAVGGLAATPLPA